MIDIDKIEAYCEKASSPPWHHTEKQVISGNYGVFHPVPSGSGEYWEAELLAHFGGVDDAEFAANARTDLPACLTEIRELRAENARLRKEGEELNNKAANLRMFLSRIASKFAWGTLDQDFVTEIMGHAQRIYPSSPLRFEGDPVGGCDK